MTLMQVLGAFRFYKADILILALGVTLLTSLLKRTLLKKVAKKVYLFLPFLIGVVFFTVYRLLTGMSESVGTTVADCFEGGFGTGCAATLYYVTYEQFFRKRRASVLTPLLVGIVPDEECEAVASEIEKGVVSLDEKPLFDFIAETLKKYALDGVSEAEIVACACILRETLLSLRKKT